MSEQIKSVINLNENDVEKSITKGNNLVKGDEIIVREFVNGIDVSFKRVINNLVGFSTSRDKESVLEFHKFVDHLKIHVGDGYTFLGKWLKKGEFLLEDILDNETDQHLPYTAVKRIGQDLGLNVAPLLYAGEYKGADQITEIALNVKGDFEIKTVKKPFQMKIINKKEEKVKAENKEKQSKRQISSKKK
ncbi:hypothetical protein NSQ93_21910 [Bacillus sp. FSL W8-0445]|uniref:hypothetical protein n=1 Tax=Bacillus TaxID=1386 RepID=UPI00237CB7B7|nr:hypothetical protein [Bacillus licheniformis]MDE1407130.1 hypothetical protein [Bacillus licheniformis]